MQSVNATLQPYLEKLVKVGWRVTYQTENAIHFEGFPSTAWPFYAACMISSIFGIVGWVVSLALLYVFMDAAFMRLYIDEHGDVRLQKQTSHSFDIKLTRPAQVSYQYAAAKSRKPLVIFCLFIASFMTLFWLRIAAAT